jgi:tetratricopeptide (TPR) repeat protein
MSHEPQLTEPLELFYSYAHEDEELRDKLETHLSMLKRQKVISQWHDRGIVAGEEWGDEIDEHLKTADIILLLVSANFLASDYCYDIELKLAMERHEAGEARVIPVILRPCDWSGAPFGKLQALPKNAKPITIWPNQDEAFTDIAKGIRKVAEELREQRKQIGPPADTMADARTTDGVKTVSSQIPRPPVVGFVARREEQGHDIVGLLGKELAPDKNQLVALWGPGGAGKTTLAAEFVRDMKEVFGGRVAWVSALGRSEFGLATLLDDVATKLGREELRKLAQEAKASQVSELLTGEPALVVLDNFETIAEEEQARCLDFLAQHAACPALITTRSRVNRDDVYNVPLAAMSMDEARDFLQRLVGRTRKPSNFDHLDRDDLIRRCEANPIVLEWVVRQIDLAKRPQDVLDDLARGEGDAAERVFTRSFNLPQLGDDGRAALLALSLFTPDASREALGEVAGFSGDLRRLNRTVENLSALWLVETTEGNERLFLRGLTRELAKSRLSKEATAEEFRQRYKAFFQLYAAAHSRPLPEDLDLLEVEKDNILGAIDSAFKAHDWRSVIQMHGFLVGFLRLRGYWDEAIRRGEQAGIAAREAKDEWEVARATGNVGMILIYRAQYEEARRLYQETLEIFRRLGSDKNIAVGLHQLGHIAYAQDDLEEALRLYGESLDIKKRYNDQSLIASTTSQIGVVLLRQGKIEESQVKHEESLAIRRRLGEQQGIAIDLHQLGRIAHHQGDLAKARQLYAESLEISKNLGDQINMATVLLNLGRLARQEGKGVEATRLLSEALQIYEKLGSPEAELARKNLEGLKGG